MFASLLLGFAVVICAVVSGIVGIVLGGALTFRSVNDAFVAVVYLVLFAVSVTMIFFGAGAATAWIGLILLGVVFGTAVRRALG